VGPREEEEAEEEAAPEEEEAEEEAAPEEESIRIQWILGLVGT